MKFCTNCRKLTAGDPMFCSTCGSTYDVRLCPRQHPNPRSAQVCSQCGSRDLSTAHPKKTLAGRVLIVFLQFLPGLLILSLTLLFFAALAVIVIRNEQWLLGRMMCLGIWLVFAWIVFLCLPQWLQRPLRAMGRSAGRALKGKPQSGQEHR